MQKDTGASVRIYNLASGLVANGHDVTVIIPKLHPTSEDVDGVHVRGFKGLLPKPMLEVLKRFVNVGRPTALYFYDIVFALRVIALLKNADIIQMEQQTVGALLIPFIKLVVKRPLVLDCHDVFQALKLKHTSMLRRMLESSSEKLAYKKADLILTVSKNEKDSLVSMGFKNHKISIIPNGVDVHSFEKSTKSRELKRKYHTEGFRTVVFVGNLAYYPNREAVNLLSSVIAPIVQSKIENVKFIIVGKKQSGLDSTRLSFTGFVDNVSDVLSISDVAVAPLFHGSGTRLKVLEYFSCGLPVVSTTVGAEGLDIRDRVNIIIENDPERFALRIVELLNDKNLSDALGGAARKLAANVYDWENIVKQLDTVLTDSFSRKL